MACTVRSRWCGDLGHREAVEIAQGRARRGGAGRARRAPRGCASVRSVRRLRRARPPSGSEPQAARLACLAPPVVDELVPRDADEPRDGELRHRVALDGLHRREERLGGEVLGDDSRIPPGRAGSRTPGGARGRTWRAARFPDPQLRVGSPGPLSHAGPSFGRARLRRARRESPRIPGRIPGVGRAGAYRRPRPGRSPMSKTVRISLVAVVMTVATACGGGYKGLSKADFVSKADGVCKSYESATGLAHQPRTREPDAGRGPPRLPRPVDPAVPQGGRRAARAAPAQGRSRDGEEDLRRPVGAGSTSSQSEMRGAKTLKGLEGLAPPGLTQASAAAQGIRHEGLRNVVAPIAPALRK